MEDHLAWMRTLGAILVSIDPFLTWLQLLTSIRFKKHSKLERDQFQRLASESFERVIIGCERLGLKRKSFAPGKKETYIKEILTSLRSKDDFYFFIKGEIEAFFIARFILSENDRFRHFALYRLLYLEGYDDYIRYMLFKERAVWLFTRKKTVLHYLSIKGWATKKYTELAREVRNVDRPNPLLNERFKAEKISTIATDQPTFTRAIDLALKKGKISERTVFNLAATEKIVMVHKYAEGFGKITKPQIQRGNELKAIVEKLKGSKAKDAENRLLKAKADLAEFNKNRIRVPLSTTLEENGFQILFRNMQGVYVLPLSMLPEKYQSNPASFIHEVIIKQAEKQLNRIAENNKKLFADFEGGLKYLILVHVVNLNQISVISRERSLNISSRTLSRMLLTSYLLKDQSEVSAIYINEIVRNVDFSNVLGDNTKTSEYLVRNSEALKKILWKSHNIDLQKPSSISSLTKQNIETIATGLYEQDKSLMYHLIVAGLIKLVDFYTSINRELKELTT